MLLYRCNSASDMFIFTAKTFKTSDVAANIDKALDKIDKTLSTVENKVFCAQAQLIATRLQIALFGNPSINHPINKSTRLRRF